MPKSILYQLYQRDLRSTSSVHTGAGLLGACLENDGPPLQDAPPAQATATPVRGDVSLRDWSELMSAVQYRLRATVGGASLAAPLPCGSEHAVKVRDAVLDCVTALEQLHQTMQHELDRKQQLELDLFDARTALAQAHIELTGSQAGELRARHQARHDHLTRLPNHAHFQERLAAALGHSPMEARTLAILYIDVDGFKAINHAHGHDAGDEMLRIIAVRLSSAIRSEDMVCRVGGDEFACLLEGPVDRLQIEHLAHKLHCAVASPVKFGELKLSVRASIGVALSPADGSTVASLLKQAGAAMVRAKRLRNGNGFDFFGKATEYA